MDCFEPSGYRCSTKTELLAFRVKGISLCAVRLDQLVLGSPVVLRWFPESCRVQLLLGMFIYADVWVYVCVYVFIYIVMHLGYASGLLWRAAELTGKTV